MSIPYKLILNKKYTKHYLSMTESNLIAGIKTQILPPYKEYRAANSAVYNPAAETASYLLLPALSGINISQP